MIKKIILATISGLAMQAGAAGADTCTGTCGTLGPNGVVTAPPAFGPNYQYVSTLNGVTGAGRIAGITGSTTGSELVTSSFAGAVGDKLNFFFNYVTSDGAGFTDYSFAELLNGGTHAAWLFTARTTTVGNTSPGFGLPANDSTLTPATSPIVGGAPTWSPLGSDSGQCFSSGCGYTGWIGSSFTLSAVGSYQLRFGVSNFNDAAFQSGLAFAGVTVNNVPVTGAVPEPATWAMMIAGFGLAGTALRRRRTAVRFTPGLA